MKSYKTIQITKSEYDVLFEHRIDEAVYELTKIVDKICHEINKKNGDPYTEKYLSKTRAWLQHRPKNKYLQEITYSCLNMNSNENFSCDELDQIFEQVEKTLKKKNIPGWEMKKINSFKYEVSRIFESEWKSL